MSATHFPADTLFTQRMLKAEGLYTGALDGIWGPLTEQAANAFAGKSKELKQQYGRFDPRTENNINTLTLRTQKEARQFMTRVQQHFSSSSRGLSLSSRRTPGSSSTQHPSHPATSSPSAVIGDPESLAQPPAVKIISGTRSYAEQNKLFRQGRYHNPDPMTL